MQQCVEQAAGRTSKQPQHPAWLQHEINKAHLRKQQAQHHQHQQDRKHQRITHQALTTRDRIRNNNARPPLSSQQQPPQPHSITFIDNQRPATSTPLNRPQVVVDGRGEKSRPKWAMTAAEEEKEMEAECDELVGYVEELDFEQWMDEMEDREAKRVEEEKEQITEGEVQREKARVPATLGDEALQCGDGEWDDNLPRPPTGIRPTQPRPHTSNSRPHTARPATSPQAAANSTETLVATLLHSSTAIRNIHSSHSLRALISSAHDNGRIQQYCTATAAPVNSVSVAIPAPLVSVVATRETLHGKINPSQLPYLHRHPAV